MEFEFGKFSYKYFDMNWYWMLIMVAAFIAIMAGIIFVIGYVQKKKGNEFTFETRDITYAAVCVGVAYALSFLGLSLPQGGTITFFSTLPIMIYCYYFGFRKGLIITAVYTTLQLIQYPIIVSVWSALLDYFIPYMALSIVGIFRYNKNNYDKIVESRKLPVLAHWRFFIGAVIYVAIRYWSHVLSGILFFADWAPEGVAPTIHSLTYNSFVFIDFAVAMVGAFGLFCSNSFNILMASKKIRAGGVRN